MTTRTVKIAAGTLAVAGTVSVLAILALSSQPNEKARAKLPHVNVEQLQPGQVMHLDTDALRYFVVRPLTGDLHVVAVPTEQGTVLMPDIYWWKPLMNCKDFGWETAAPGVMTDFRFRCRDQDQPEEWAKKWQWDMYGKHIAESTESKIDNMYRVRIVRSGSEVSFTGLEPD